MIQVAWNDTRAVAELVEVAQGQLARAPDDLVSAVILSLFTNRRVEAEDVPAGVSQGGWWGEAFPRETGARMGSRLWTIPLRGRDDAQALNLAREASLEALAWMTTRGLVDDLAVTVERIRPGALGIHVAWQIAGTWRPQLSLTFPLS